MIDENIIRQYQADGIAIVPSVIPKPKLALLRDELEAAQAEDLATRPDVFDAGMVHNCMFRGAEMLKLLDDPIINAYLKFLLADSFILYAYQASSLAPKQNNYGSRIHVDCPRYLGDYRTNGGAMIALDEFTLENGATHYLKGSHTLNNEDVAQISADFFFENSERALCNAGDVILIDPRLVHAAGTNNTHRARHALTMNFCRCFMRQRFDYSRMITPEQLSDLGEDGKRMIGWNVRMPSSLDEFYLPEDERLYKPGQE